MGASEVVDDRRELSSVVAFVVTESDRLGGGAVGVTDAFGAGQGEAFGPRVLQTRNWSYISTMNFFVPITSRHVPVF